MSIAGCDRFAGDDACGRSRSGLYRSRAGIEPGKALGDGLLVTEGHGYALRVVPGQLDVDLARDAAPLVAFDNLTEHDFYSARIGCQTFGIYGMDLAALCLRGQHRQ